MKYDFKFISSKSDLDVIIVHGCVTVRAH